MAGMSEATRTRTHTPEVRQRAVEILQEGVGHRALAAKLGIPQATARQWARAYAVGGADAVLNAGARHHTYSYDVKLAVVKDRLENGLTVREAMIKHKIPSESSVKAWCRQYRDGGADAVLNAGSHHHTYSYDVKLAVVKDRLENGLTVREAMIKHKIPSESSVKAWCRQYRESGEAALVDKPRGRKPRVKKAE